MAGRGPAPKDPSTRARGNKTSTRATLRVIDPSDVHIPELPPAEDFVASPFPADSEYYEEPRWNPAVVRWWRSIWSSPMSAEFSESDIHGLYLACKQLQESLNPRNKPTEQAAFMTKFEQSTRNFGLNPMSRRSLQWEIDRGDEAADRTDRRRQAKAQHATPKPAFDPRKKQA